MKMNTKMMAFVVALAFAVGAFSVFATAENNDAAAGETFVIDDFTYTIITDATAADGETAAVPGTVSVAATNPASLSGTVTLVSSVTHPDDAGLSYNVVEVSAQGFEGATCTNVVLPDSITKLGGGAFKSSKITSLDLNKVTIIASGVFQGCDIEILTVPSTVVNIGDAIVQNATKLQTLQWDTSFKIGNNYFSGCTSLKEVTVSSALVIGDNTFNGCTALETFTQTTIKEIGKQAFLNCSKLGSFDFTNVTKVQDQAFQNTGLVTLTIPQTLNNWGVKAFMNSTSLQSVEWNSNSPIPSSTFKGCSSLKSFTAPNTYKVNANAFDGAGFTTLELPSTITSIQAQAFANTQIKKIVVTETVNLASLNVFPQAGYKYSDNSTLVSWSPALPQSITAGTYNAVIAGGDPTSFEIAAIDSELIYAVGDSFNYSTLSLELTLADESTTTIASTDSGFKGVTWYSDADCTTAYTPGTTPLTATMTKLYVKYGTYDIDAVEINLEIIDATGYDSSGDDSIDDLLNNGTTKISIPADVVITQDITLVEGAEILFKTGAKITGNISYDTASVQLIDATFATNTLISQGSIHATGSLASGIVIFEGACTVDEYFAVASGVVVIYKSGATITVSENSSLILAEGSYLQANGVTPVYTATGATYVNNAEVLSDTDYLSNDNAATIIGTDYPAASTVKLKISNDYLTDTWERTNIRWYLIDQSDASNIITGVQPFSASASEVEIIINETALAERGTYDLYITASKNLDGEEPFAVSSNFAVTFLDEGYILGMYVDTGVYHAIVKNLEGDVLPGTVYAYAYVSATVTLDAEISYVKISDTVLSYEIKGAEGSEPSHLGDVDYTFASNFGSETVVGLQAKYDCRESTDGFRIYSKQILAPGISPGDETHAAEGTEKAVVYFGTIEKESTGGTTTSTPVIYLYSTVAYQDAQLTLWYNNGESGDANANVSVTLDVDVAANGYLIVEYTEFKDDTGAALFVDDEGNLDFGDCTIMSAYISVTNDNGTTDDTTDDTTTTTLEVLAY